MPRFKAIVSYDGTNYAGWQVQPGKVTIQETIESIMEKFCLKKMHITASGRTDAGVHAVSQVFHFDCDDYKLSAEKWKVALNGHLPKDIRIHSVVEVNPEFHARFHAIGKRYDYLINLGEYNVFTRTQQFYCYYKLDVEKMKSASKIFLGTHDFTTFNASPLELHPDQVRTIHRIDFIQENDTLRITFEGTGFLRYMVRMLTGTLIEAGRGRITEKEIQEMLDKKDKKACRFNAKPWGLYLMRVDYENGWEI